MVPPHPLIKHWIAILRNATSPPPIFRAALAELGRNIAYEATRDWLPMIQGEVATPCGVAEVEAVDPYKPIAATVYCCSVHDHRPWRTTIVSRLVGDGLLRLPSPLPSSLNPSSLFPPLLFFFSPLLSSPLISSPLLSSPLISSPLLSSHLLSSPLLSSPLLSSPLLVLPLSTARASACVHAWGADHPGAESGGGHGGADGASHSPHHHLPPRYCHLPPRYCHLPPRYCHLPPRYCHLPPRYCHLPPRYCHLPPR
ncbi:unnamed protein product [Closterium sp. NIES-54]